MNAGPSGQVAAARMLGEVIGRGRSLAQVVHGAPAVDRRRRALARELTYGTLRWLPRLDRLIAALVERPIRPRDVELRVLIALGLYQLGFTAIPAHAAVDATVGACAELGKGWARGFVNGVLRRYLRERETLEAALADDPEYAHAHPRWLLERLQEDWPAHWRSICAANNARAPMTLRVNRRRGPREIYLERLAGAGIAARPLGDLPEAVVLERPCDVEALPGFAEGAVSVQDGAAQLAAHLLAPAAGERVLDACAAPGGKTAHLLELQPALARLVALDVDAARLARVEEGLARLGLAAEVVAGDATRPGEWWDGRPFERILADVPCSATGVIRRQPDVKLHRRPADLDTLAATQRDILEGIWPLLAPRGKLLYSTCSVLPEENQRQIDAFVRRHDDASVCPISAERARPLDTGIQVLPGGPETGGEDDGGLDGFYYALLTKD